MSTEKAAVEQPPADDAAGAEATPEPHTEPHTGPHTGPDSEKPAEAGDAAEEQGDKPAPSWWHRDHPTFAALSGFFTGLLFVALVPAVFVGVLSLIFDTEEVEDLFPFVLVTLVVPLALVANKRTRRFGTYFWLGMVLTAVVVVGVASVVLWYLVENQK